MLELSLEWVSALEIDHGEIDKQHQYLFTLYNSILDEPEDGLDKSALLVALTGYAANHFQDEEIWMQAIGYPIEDYDHHQAQHQGFVKQLEDLSELPLYETLDFIREWLLRHIMTEDHKIRLFTEHGPESTENCGN